MISADALSASNSHVTLRYDFEEIRRLDRDGRARTSISLPRSGSWLLVSPPAGPPPEPFVLPANTSSGTTLPATVSARLLELTRLEADWDSYGALPMSNRAVAAAGALISRILARSGDRGVPHEITPIADGGVSLEWRYPSRELGLNACPEGGWSYLLVERDEKGRHYTEGYDLSDEDAAALVFQTVGPLLA